MGPPVRVLAVNGKTLGNFSRCDSSWPWRRDAVVDWIDFPIAFGQAHIGQGFHSVPPRDVGLVSRQPTGLAPDSSARPP